MRISELEIACAGRAGQLGDSGFIQLLLLGHEIELALRELRGRIPSGAEAPRSDWYWMYGLKPIPFTRIKAGDFAELEPVLFY